MNKIISVFFLVLCSLFANAQSEGPQMADGMRADGKIYVVIGVLGVIFISIVLFLIILERKISKIEKQIKK